MRLLVTSNGTHASAGQIEWMILRRGQQRALGNDAIQASLIGAMEEQRAPRRVPGLEAAGDLVHRADGLPLRNVGSATLTDNIVTEIVTSLDCVLTIFAHPRSLQDAHHRLSILRAAELDAQLALGGASIGTTRRRA